LVAYAKAPFNFRDESPFALPNPWKIPYNPALNLVFKHI